LGLSVDSTGRPHVLFAYVSGGYEYVRTRYALSSSWSFRDFIDSSTTISYGTWKTDFFDVEAARYSVYRRSDGDVVYAINASKTVLCNGTLDGAARDRSTGLVYVLACGSLYVSSNWSIPIPVDAGYRGRPVVRNGHLYTCSGTRVAHRAPDGTWRAEVVSDLSYPTEDCDLVVDSAGTIELGVVHVTAPYDWAGMFVNLYRGQLGGTWETRRIRDVDANADPVYHFQFSPAPDDSGWGWATMYQWQSIEGHDVGTRRAWSQSASSLQQVIPN
jgi:hypothetical protein